MDLIFAVAPNTYYYEKFATLILQLTMLQAIWDLRYLTALYLGCP